MTCLDPAYQACRELFACYPQATRAVNRSGTVLSMVVMLQNGDHAGFYVISEDGGSDKPSYLFWSWPAGKTVDITEDGCNAASDEILDVVRCGTPIPKDGSLYGWVCDGAVTALIVIYVESVPDLAEPAWAVMPLAGTPEARWPPFTGKRLFGHWSWDECRAGRVISLGETIGLTPGTVWWVDTKDALGANSCAVARDIITPQGCILRRGCYVYYRVLQWGQPIPALEGLLRDRNKVDLAHRFQFQQDASVSPDYQSAFPCLQGPCGD